MVTDRPDFTESASTVKPGRFQFELGYTYTRQGEETLQDFGELLVRLGVLPGTEVRLGLNSLALLRSSSEDRTGLEDLTVGVKIVLHRRREESSSAEPQVALLAGVDLPTGASGLGADGVQPAAVLALGFELAEGLALGSNLGWAYVDLGNGRLHQGVASLSIGYAIGTAISVYGEGYGLFPEYEGGGGDFYLNGGLTWALGLDVQLDGRVGVGLQEPSPNAFAGLGLSFRL